VPARGVDPEWRGLGGQSFDVHQLHLDLAVLAVERDLRASGQPGGAGRQQLHHPVVVGEQPLDEQAPHRRGATPREVERVAEGRLAPVGAAVPGGRAVLDAEHLGGITVLRHAADLELGGFAGGVEPHLAVDLGDPAAQVLRLAKRERPVSRRPAPFVAVRVAL
jgi:hypothetical protein